MKILITGCAGFIGFHLSLSILQKKNVKVFGLDNINNYYDVDLKKNRLKILKQNKNFIFHKLDINKDTKKINLIFKKNKFKYVVHLAAQAGVRYSLKNPQEYLNSNIVGFYNIIELAAKYKIKHFLFASTSSVYGNSSKFPTHENHSTDQPLSFYAASKKCNEIIAASFSNVYKIPTTALRFFTVYGPYGRPDMSLFIFTENILKSKPIYLFNNGKHIRDFTYVDDVVNSINKLLNKPLNSKIPYQAINVSSSKPHQLKKFLNIIEKKLDKKTLVKMSKMQIGDVYKTFASTKKLKKNIGKIEFTPLNKGISNFINWYKKYYNYK